MIGIVMFVAALVMLAIGYPVAFTFGSVSNDSKSAEIVILSFGTRVKGITLSFP